MEPTPTQTAQLVWAIAIGILLAYEVWALTQGYEWTLTAGMRAWLDEVEYLKGLLGALLAWLFVHFVIERKKRKGKE